MKNYSQINLTSEKGKTKKQICCNALFRGSHLLLLFLFRHLQSRWIGEGGGFTVGAILHLGHLKGNRKQGSENWYNRAKVNHQSSIKYYRFPSLLETLIHHSNGLSSVYEWQLFRPHSHEHCWWQLFKTTKWNFSSTQPIGKTTQTYLSILLYSRKKMKSFVLKYLMMFFKDTMRAPKYL